MSTLTDLGYRLVPGKPDAEGLMMFKLYDRNGIEVAHTDEPGTLDDALAMARAFVEELELENNSPLTGKE